LLRDSRLPIETYVGRTPEIIHLAHACAAVSGSVSLELLSAGLPSVIIYRVGRLARRLARHFLTCRYITLVNLLAGRELYPEFLSDRCEAEGVAGHVLCWLNDPAARAAVCQELAALRQGVAAPGACERTARYVLDALERGQARPAA
jgi:lipid-A-disaccharide synthase